VGELIEHCAYPEKIIEKILEHIRPGGLLILTTPNGARARIKAKLPTFKEVLIREQREIFEERQFGPNGRHHLFSFNLEEIKYIVPRNAKLVKKVIVEEQT